ncbi:hypothetical protein BDZ94DRAFT_1301170 [Collybia nuda]|uniref:BTB domain-containing protein n=1 Tax=Collybia nuda TaxID=64659 RepID=A0A9P5XZG3_9AGAR|nr:hypothetical protein BDZ94DRAFT_1301170 [Collybia nuda]
MSDEINASTNLHSEKFNAIDADIIFKSFDNVHFKIHRKNLESCTGGFPPAGFETLGEILPLTESASTLELLFQFIYPMPQPNLRSCTFEILAAVAEAAEKYQVYSAIYICVLIMEMKLPENAPMIFGHAGRHDHIYLLGKAAPYLIGKPLDEVASELPGHLIIPWIKYHMAWEKQLQKARLYPERNVSWALSDAVGYIFKFKEINDLKDLNAIFGDRNENGNAFNRYLDAWRDNIESNILGMKTFDKYLIL